LLPPALISPSAKCYEDGDLIFKMCQYANDMVDQAVTRILAGNVAPQAVDKGACEYCPVKILCPQAKINCRDQDLHGKTITYKTFAEVKHE